MARKGLAGQALSISTASSVFGGVFSTLVLMFAAPWLAEQALRFGPAEYFALAVFGLSTIAGMGGDSVLRSLISGVLGLPLLQSECRLRSATRDSTSETRTCLMVSHSSLL